MVHNVYNIIVDNALTGKNSITLDESNMVAGWVDLYEIAEKVDSLSTLTGSDTMILTTLGLTTSVYAFVSRNTVTGNVIVQLCDNKDEVKDKITDFQTRYGVK